MGKAVTGLNKPNETNNFYPADDKWDLVEMPVIVSTVIEEGSAMSIEISSNNVTWYITKSGVENAAGSDFVGILAEPIIATDDDYATAGKLKWVWIPRSIYAEAFFTVGAGTFTAVDVFKAVEIHSDSYWLAVDTIWKGARISWYISSTRWRCIFNLPTTETA